MLSILLVCWKIDSAEFRLNYQTPLMRVRGKIDFDRELYTVRAVYLLEQLLLISSKTYITELLCQNNGRELNSSAPFSQDY